MKRNIIRNIFSKFTVLHPFLDFPVQAAASEAKLLN